MTEPQESKGRQLGRRSFLKKSLGAAGALALTSVVSTDRFSFIPSESIPWTLRGAQAGLQGESAYAIALHFHSHTHHAGKVISATPGGAPSMSWHSAEAVKSGVKMLWHSEHEHMVHQKGIWERTINLHEGEPKVFSPDTSSAVYGSGTPPPLSARLMLKLTPLSGDATEIGIIGNLSWNGETGARDQFETRAEIVELNSPIYVDLAPETLEPHDSSFADNALERVNITARGGGALVRIRLFARQTNPRAIFAVHNKLAMANALKFGTTEFFGLEYPSTHANGHYFHNNAYTPRSEFLPIAALDPAQMRDEVHRKGGLLSVNHPFGTRKIEPNLRVRPATRARDYVQHNAFEADVLEIGYLDGRGEGTGPEHLLFWDVLTAHMNFLASPRYIPGVGVTDSHGGLPHGGYHCTWLLADNEPTQAEVVDIMRRGRMFFGNYTVFPINGVLDLSIDEEGNVSTMIPLGFEGKLVSVPILDQPNYQARQRVEDVPSKVTTRKRRAYRLEARKAGKTVASTQHTLVG